MLPHRHLGKSWLILGEFTSWFAPMTSFVPTMNHYCGSWYIYTCMHHVCIHKRMYCTSIICMYACTRSRYAHTYIHMFITSNTKTWQHIATCYKANVWQLKKWENIARENDWNSERPGRMTEDGDSLVVYKSSQVRICMEMHRHFNCMNMYGNVLLVIIVIKST